jgi:hypothetical protein
MMRFRNACCLGKRGTAATSAKSPVFRDVFEHGLPPRSQARGLQSSAFPTAIRVKKVTATFCAKHPPGRLRQKVAVTFFTRHLTPDT